MRPSQMLRSVLLMVFFLSVFLVFSYSARSIFFRDGLCNTAGPFGVILPSVVFGTILTSIFVGLSIVWWKQRNEDYSFVWLIIISAGLSNVSERFFFGCVYDYIALSWWPVFNIADVALFLSVVFLVWREFKTANMKD